MFDEEGVWEGPATAFLPCKNGMVCLETGEIDPSDHDHEVLVGVEYPGLGGAEKATRWVDFLTEALGGLGCVDTMQELLGVMLTGYGPSRVIGAVILTGVGGSGKSTFLHVLHGVLGGLAVNVQVDRADLVNVQCQLQDSRFAWIDAVEGPRGVGVDLRALLAPVMCCPRSDGRNLIFRAQHTLFLATNSHPGRISHRWGEFRFNAPAKAERGLAKRLMEEAPYILAWMVQGAVRWQGREC